MTIPLSVLDLVPIGSGQTAMDAMRNSLDLAQLADRLGFERYWFAEHHGMPSIASSTPEILIARAAGATQRIRVGSGGVMMQNHVPLKLAEAFHTLEALYPGRIDLGIGRAPGTDPTTSQALRPFGPERFREQMTELLALSRKELPAEHPFARVRVVPEGVSLPPIWLLGSSGASAAYAGSLGIGYSFASHFSPAPAQPAVSQYRQSFVPSEQFSAPHAILGVSVICADSEQEAEHLAASGELVWVRLQRGEFAPIPTPEEALRYPYTPAERAVAAGYRRLQIVGTPDVVADRIRSVARQAEADEVIVSSGMIHSPEARLRSFELLARAFGLSEGRTAAQLSTSATGDRP